MGFTEIDIKATYITNHNYSAQTISGITVIIPISEDCPKFNGMMKLTGIGPFLWNYFSVGSTVENACKAVCEKYAVSYEKANTDIQSFVASLCENGLLLKN